MSLCTTCRTRPAQDLVAQPDKCARCHIIEHELADYLLAPKGLAFVQKALVDRFANEPRTLPIGAYATATGSTRNSCPVVQLDQTPDFDRCVQYHETPYYLRRLDAKTWVLCRTLCAEDPAGRVLRERLAPESFQGILAGLPEDSVTRAAGIVAYVDTEPTKH